MLEVRQVSKLYENNRGVRGINFSMTRGEIVGFLGPNGAGKTTTMRMITGYLNPTRGEILVDSLNMSDHPKQARKKIGYLPETPPLYPDMTVMAYLKFIADLRDVPVRDRKMRISEAISKLGLNGREKQVIRSLSKGYKQRLGLAQAILHKPDLLVLDEPTSGLDPKQIIEIRELIKELGQNHTVLLSTHILPEVNALCNRVLIINQGEIVMDEKPERLGQSMGQKFAVVLTVKGPQQAIVSALQSTRGVGEVHVLTSSDGNEPVESASTPEVVRLRVTAADQTDIREAVFFRLAEQGLPILEMQPEKMSLEEVFLKLTTTESSGEASAETGENEASQQPEPSDAADSGTGEGDQRA